MIKDLQKTINLATEKVWARFKVTPPMTGAAWADEHFFLPPDSSQIPGRWKSIHFQVAILNMMSNDAIQMLDVMKSSRVGYTKMMTSTIAYNVCHRSRNQALWYPTDDEYKDYDKDELVPLYPHVPQFAEKFPWHDKKSPKNTARLKKFIGANLYLRGSQSSKNFRRFGVSIGYFDEFDEFPLDVEGQGSPTTLAWKRTEGAPHRKIIRGSSPTIMGQSQIEAGFKDADVRMRFNLECPECGYAQDLKFGGRDTEYGFKWIDGDSSTVKYQCRDCKGFSSQRDFMADAENSGFWYCDETKIWTKDGIKFYIEDKLVRAPKHVAVHIWTAYSPLVSWVEIIDEWIKCKNKPLELKSFINTTLAETYDLKQGEKVRPKALMDRTEDFGYIPLPKEVCLITAGVDVQQDRFEIQFLGWTASGEVWVLKYEILKCDTALETSWDTILDPALEYEFQTQNGISLFAESVGVDTGFETQRAYAFCLKNAHKSYLALKGMDGDRPIIPIKPNRKWGKAPAGLKGWSLGADTVKTVIMGMLSIQKPGENYIHFPSDGLPHDYFDQITSETRILKVNKTTNKRKYMWYLPQGKRNEALDNFGYALAAKEHLNIDLDGRWDELQTQSADGEVDWKSYFEGKLNK